MSDYSKVIFFAGSCNYRKESALSDVNTEFGGPASDDNALNKRMRALGPLKNAKEPFSPEEVKEAIKTIEAFRFQEKEIDPKNKKYVITGVASKELRDYIDEKCVLLFSEKKVMTGKWNWKSYIDLLHQHLGDVLADSDWKYVLSKKAPPVFRQGKRDFIVSSGDPRSKKETEFKVVDGFLCGHTGPQEKVMRLLRGVVKDEILKSEENFVFDEGGENYKVRNENSPTIKSKLAKFVTRLTKRDLGIEFPVFSVSDCNTFHNTGYLWGLYAVKMAFDQIGRTGAVAVLNFDQHDDEGYSKNKWVLSSAWGRPLISEAEIRESGGCYVVLGMPEAKNSTYAYKAHYRKAGTDEFGTAPGDAAKEEFWAEIIKQIGVPIEYIFITVDRDCLLKHYTAWQDMDSKKCKFKDADELTKVADDILTALRDACLADYKVERHGEQTIVCRTIPDLIGFDVTGLPDSILISKQVRPWDKEETVWGYANKDVKTFLKWADKELKQTAQWKVE